jgi:hypothetical protein
MLRAQPEHRGTLPTVASHWWVTGEPRGLLSPPGSSSPRPGTSTSTGVSAGTDVGPDPHPPPRTMSPSAWDWGSPRGVQGASGGPGHHAAAPTPTQAVTHYRHSLQTALSMVGAGSGPGRPSSLSYPKSDVESEGEEGLGHHPHPNHQAPVPGAHTSSSASSGGRVAGIVGKWSTPQEFLLHFARQRYHKPPSALLGVAAGGPGARRRARQAPAAASVAGPVDSNRQDVAGPEGAAGALPPTHSGGGLPSGAPGDASRGAGSSQPHQSSSSPRRHAGGLYAPTFASSSRDRAKAMARLRSVGKAGFTATSPSPGPSSSPGLHGAASHGTASPSPVPFPSEVAKGPGGGVLGGGGSPRGTQGLQAMDREPPCSLEEGQWRVSGKPRTKARAGGKAGGSGSGSVGDGLGTVDPSGRPQGVWDGGSSPRGRPPSSLDPTSHHHVGKHHYRAPLLRSAGSEGGPVSDGELTNVRRAGDGAGDTLGVRLGGRGQGRGRARGRATASPPATHTRAQALPPEHSGSLGEPLHESPSPSADPGSLPSAALPSTTHPSSLPAAPHGRPDPVSPIAYRSVRGGTRSPPTVVVPPLPGCSSGSSSNSNNPSGLGLPVGLGAVSQASSGSLRGLRGLGGGTSCSGTPSGHTPHGSRSNSGSLLGAAQGTVWDSIRCARGMVEAAGTLGDSGTGTGTGPSGAALTPLSSSVGGGILGGACSGVVAHAHVRMDLSPIASPASGSGRHQGHPSRPRRRGDGREPHPLDLGSGVDLGLGPGLEGGQGTGVSPLHHRLREYPGAHHRPHAQRFSVTICTLDPVAPLGAPQSDLSRPSTQGSSSAITGSTRSCVSASMEVGGGGGGGAAGIATAAAALPPVALGDSAGGCVEDGATSALLLAVAKSMAMTPICPPRVVGRGGEDPGPGPTPGASCATASSATASSATASPSQGPPSKSTAHSRQQASPGHRPAATRASSAGSTCSVEGGGSGVGQGRCTPRGVARQGAAPPRGTRPASGASTPTPTHPGAGASCRTLGREGDGARAGAGGSSSQHTSALASSALPRRPSSGRPALVSRLSGAEGGAGEGQPSRRGVAGVHGAGTSIVVAGGRRVRVASGGVVRSGPGPGPGQGQGHTAADT